MFVHALILINDYYFLKNLNLYTCYNITGRVSQEQNQRTKPVGNSSSSRVLRLFGVNMECQPEHEHEHDSSSTPQCSYDTNNNNNMSLTQYHQPNTSNSNPHVVRHQPYYY